MVNRPYAIIEAPSILGLRPSGVQDLPQALLGHGLATRLGARLAERLPEPGYRDERDRDSSILNGREMAEWSPRLADAVERVLDAGECPIVLGGDCSIILGPLLALRRRGRYGLLFIDGHADFYQPEAEPRGEAASMDLALATGYGPELLTNLEGRRPLVRSGDVCAFGFRDGDEQAEHGSQPLPDDLLAYDLGTIREIGVDAAMAAAVRHLTRPHLDGFFLHLDADCLDDRVMPAVDYRLAGGLSVSELRQALRAATDTGKVMGITVTIYNPRLDGDGAAGRALTDVIVDALGSHVLRRS